MQEDGMTTAYELAKKEVGTLEVAGAKHNPKVLQYFRDAGHPEIVNDETAWCAAFVGAMLERSGVPSTRALNARSYLKWGQPVALEDAKPGDIVVFQRGDSAWQGHVAFYEAQGATKITVLGGNQSDSVNRSSYPISKLLGVRRAVKPASPRVKDIALTVPGQDRPNVNPVAYFLNLIGAALKMIFASMKK
jgi:uncharacterized protein (TIGR02594 family)